MKNKLDIEPELPVGLKLIMQELKPVDPKPLARRELETRCWFQNGFATNGKFERDVYRIFNGNNITKSEEK